MLAASSRPTMPHESVARYASIRVRTIIKASSDHSETSEPGSGKKKSIENVDLKKKFKLPAVKDHYPKRASPGDSSHYDIFASDWNLSIKMGHF